MIIEEEIAIEVEVEDIDNKDKHSRMEQDRADIITEVVKIIIEVVELIILNQYKKGNSGNGGFH
jgi:hypothetical protein